MSFNIYYQCSNHMAILCSIASRMIILLNMGTSMAVANSRPAEMSLLPSSTYQHAPSNLSSSPTSSTWLAVSLRHSDRLLCITEALFTPPIKQCPGEGCIVSKTPTSARVFTAYSSSPTRPGLCLSIIKSIITSPVLSKGFTP